VPITELRIEGLRTLERARLGLNGLTVLIGENSSGKSSIIEACEILRRATSERFLDEFYTIHGGLGSLLRQGAPLLRLGVTVQVKPGETGNEEADREVSSECESVRYDLTLMPAGSFASIHELVEVKPSPHAMWFGGTRTRKKTRKRTDMGF
jgi:predicted ATPase